ncbi:thioredoxin reductase [Micromonospora sp. NPDC007230]|uniref:thioredoxin reductase n=1 Tax=Micromonospora sp. NPDC007230 TaxID=3364237 RepID=UPI003699BEA5
MRDLRYEMTAALAGAGLVDAAHRERVADLCAGVAERYCAELGHTPAVRSGEIAELAQGEPAADWAPTPADDSSSARLAPRGGLEPSSDAAERAW